jgi:steroid delta-isomerase-like uncharacterized protein
VDEAAFRKEETVETDADSGYRKGNRSSRAELDLIARRWISLWCVPVDWVLFDSLHADDFEDCSPAGRDSSKKAFADGLAELTSAFPDLRTEVEDLVIDEEVGRVAVRWAGKGTGRRGYRGIKATNRQIVFGGIEIIEVRDRRVARRWGEWDISAHESG